MFVKCVDGVYNMGMSNVYPQVQELDQKIDKCCFSMTRELVITRSDNAFCRFFNNSNVLSLDEYIEDGGAEELKKVLLSVEEGNTTTFATRIMARKKTRLCLLYMTFLLDEFNVVLYDTVCLRDMIDMLSSNEKKNSAILSLLHVTYFLFDIDSLTVSVTNTQSLGNPEIFLLEDFRDKFIAALKANGMGKLSSEDEAVVDSLVADLKAGKSERTYTLKSDKGDIAVVTKGLDADFMHRGQVLGVIGGSNAQAEVSLSKEVSIDGLTGAMNKKAILEYARHSIDDEKKNTTIMIMDLDDFKRINDTYGHAFGDDVIIKFSQVLASSVGTKGKVGRFGGDEFFIVAVGMDDIPSIREISRNIRLGIQWAYISQMPDLILTCSIGIARYPADAPSFKDAFSLSDKMLYLAKAKGKNRYIYYNPSVHSGLDLKKITTAKMLKADALNKFYAESQMDILEKLFLRSMGWFDAVMELLIKQLSLKQVMLYRYNLGKWSLEKSYGVQVKDVRSAVLGEKYLALFDKSDILINDNSTMYEVVKKWLFEMYVSEKIMSSYEFLCRGTRSITGVRGEASAAGDEGRLDADNEERAEAKIEFLLCLDRGFPSRRWTEDERRILEIVCCALKRYGVSDRQ